MKASELREKYFQFFQSKNHKLIPSASIIPENDPTVLFTTAGMHPLVPFLLGQPHSLGKRLVNVQKCIRTGDIDEVGNTTHHTFFEMLGNRSLGDYFKKEAIEYSYEFLTKVLNIPQEKLGITVFGGDERFPDLPKDDEAYKIWKEIGIDENKIFYYKGGVIESENNWWGPAGETGPCGPDSEMHYWVSDEPVPENFDPEDKRWVEVWNDVFMQYNKNKEGKYVILSQQNVDTGMGLERTLAIFNGLDDNYLTDLFLPIIKKVEELSSKEYKGNERSMRIISDHLKAATMIMGDDKGIAPSNTDQGYIVRRLIRRSINEARKLGINESFCKKIAEEVINIYRTQYPEVERNKNFIFTELEKEEAKFQRTIEKGLREFEKIQGDISGHQAFILYTTHGFPVELIKEMAEERGSKVNVEEYKEEFKKHQELSRTAAEGKFKSGLADNSEQTTKLHTAAHLLLSALNKVLGEGISQRGSNINPERLRMDFNFERKLTDEEKKQVEDQVNEWIKQEIKVTREEMSVDEAKAQGAKGIFDSKYGDKVSVYTIENSSKEICTGPHVENTKEIGTFKIKKEQSVSSGVRRIKAVLS